MSVTTICLWVYNNYSPISVADQVRSVVECNCQDIVLEFCFHSLRFAFGPKNGNKEISRFDTQHVVKKIPRQQLSWRRSLARIVHEFLPPRSSSPIASWALGRLAGCFADSLLPVEEQDFPWELLGNSPSPSSMIAWFVLLARFQYIEELLEQC